jgi:putative transposase
MSRSLRLEHPGALWHVLNRGVERRTVFLSDADRTRFLELLATVVAAFRWRLHAFVLMSNHFHLLVETVEPTLSRGMQKLTGDYAEYFNWRHDRVGHLFQGRFTGHLVDSERYFLEVARYIVLNPVRAQMVSEPSEWCWSSYRATAGIVECPSWLTISDVLDRFDSGDHVAAMGQYSSFVASRIGDGTSPWDHLVGQIYLGSESFIERMQRRIYDQSPLSGEHPLAQRTPRCASLEQVLRIVLPTSDRSRTRRLAFAQLARTEALATLPQIGERLGIGSTGASYLVITAGQRIQSDPSFAGLVEELRQQIRNC